MLLVRLVHHAIRAFDRVQVELHGRYSISRLHEFTAYTKSASIGRSLAIIVLTPLPCLVTTILLELPTLKDPARGVYDQTAWLWCRACYSITLSTLCIIAQMEQCSPALTLTTLRRWGISLALGLFGTLCFFVFGIFIGFPTPFASQLVTIPWIWLLIALLRHAWIDVVRRDSVTRRQLQRYGFVWASQVAVLFSYPIYYYIFTKLEGTAQTLFTVVLSLLKLLFKNWVAYGLVYMEDLKPTIIIFNVDAFHALFVSRTTQKATGGSTLAIIMAIDVLQSTTALAEVHRVLQRITRPINDTGGPIGTAIRILETSTFVQNHPEITRRRVSKQSVITAGSHQIAPTPGPPSVLTDNDMAAAVVRTAPKPGASQQDQVQLQSVLAALSVLHMTESYLLIEFVETIIATIYAIYLLAMTRLPNRKFYTHLNQLSDAEMLQAATDVAMYAASELASFIVVCLALNWQLRPFSTLHQLAFVLGKHWRMIQTMLLLWVVFVNQLSLEHTGSDYTFKFAWLRPPT